VTLWVCHYLNSCTYFRRKYRQKPVLREHKLLEKTHILTWLVDVIGGTLKQDVINGSGPCRATWSLFHDFLLRHPGECKI
jgi:hypothetical protein